MNQHDSMFSQNLGWERPPREENRSRVLAEVLPPAGQIFEKWHPLTTLDIFLSFFLQFSSRVLAGVLPPAGQIFEK